MTKHCSHNDRMLHLLVNSVTSRYLFAPTSLEELLTELTDVERFMADWLVNESDGRWLLRDVIESLAGYLNLPTCPVPSEVAMSEIVAMSEWWPRTQATQNPASV